MIYYIKEIQKDSNHKKTAGVKARMDLEHIFDSLGMKSLLIPSIDDERESANTISKLCLHKKVVDIWSKNVSTVGKEDIIILQFPVVEHSVLLYKAIRKLRRRGTRVVLFIHDLEIFRFTKRSDYSFARRLRLYFEEITILDAADAVVVHNSKMKRALCERLNIEGNKMMTLGVFDYLIPDYNHQSIKERWKDGPIIVSGNLHPQKAGYVYELPEKPSFNLYGVNYRKQKKENLEYKGSFSSEEIPFAMEGSFGLVWDGSSSNTCEGPFGEYLKINNPHKTSLYLACGIPVIIWEEAALADFVLENDVGITVKSLYEISEKIDKMTEEEYMNMKNNATKLSESLKKGEYTKAALKRLSLYNT